MRFALLLAFVGSPGAAYEQSLPVENESAVKEGSAVVRSSVDQATSAAPAAREAAEDGDILVTGSRVVTSLNNSPTPVTVVGVQELAQTTPWNVADGLNKLPQFGNSSGRGTGAGGPSFNSVGNYPNVCAIGPVRTLVLCDGRHVPSTATGGQVDASMHRRFMDWMPLPAS